MIDHDLLGRVGKLLSNDNKSDIVEYALDEILRRHSLHTLAELLRTPSADEDVGTAPPRRRAE